MTHALPRPAALPMYDADRDAVEAFWRGLAAAMRDEGLVDLPEHPLWPADLDAHWRDPRLLLSQTCGFPLVTRLRDRVQVIGAFRRSIEGCEGIDYRSALVVRAASPGDRIEDFRDRTIAVNDRHSFSGCHALRALVAPLADDEGRYFGPVVWTGSHRASLEAVRAGEADLAAIDVVTLAGLARRAGGAGLGVRVIGHTARAPGLPLITARSTPPDTLEAVRRALAAACASPALAGIRAALFIDGFETASAADWAPIERLHRQAGALAAW